MAQNATYSPKPIPNNSVLTTIPRRGGLPPFLMTCRDGELDEIQDLTDLVAWTSYFLPEYYQQVVKNANFHHKYQEQLVKLLKWIVEHPNENPSIGQFESMLDPVDPNTPNRVRCPRRDCAKVNTRVHIAAHMLQGDHAGLPVYYCVYNDTICQKFFHAADRDRHRENKHQIARPRTAKGKQPSKPYAKQPKSTKTKASVDSIGVPHIAQSSTYGIPSQPGPSSSSFLPSLATPQESSHAGIAPDAGADPFGAPPNVQYQYAPIPEGHVPNIDPVFSSTRQFYELPPWDQQGPSRFSNTSSSNLTTRGGTHVAQAGSHQTRPDPAFYMPHQMTAEDVTNSNNTTGLYSHSNNPPPIQNGSQVQPRNPQYDQATYQVGPSESGVHGSERLQRGGRRPHDPFPSLLTDMALVILLVFLLGYIYRLDFLYETMST